MLLSELWSLNCFENGGCFVKKYKMAAAAIMNCYLVTLDHARSPLCDLEVCVKISFQSIYYFQKYRHLKILQLFLKTTIPAPKFKFFSSSRPSKGTSLGESASFKVYIVKIRPPVVAVGDNGWTDFHDERKGKVHKVTGWLYFSIMGRRPRWTDFHKD